MPGQTHYINKINTILSLHRGTQVRLNEGGVCAGLAAIFIKYTLEGKKQEFDNMLDQVFNLPNDYKIGTNAELDKFIIDVEKAYKPAVNIQRHIGQADIEESIKVNGKTPRNEYNVGLVTSEDNWGIILNDILKENRSILILSHNHAIAIHFKNNKIILYDPNADSAEEFDNSVDAITRIQECFFYKSKPFGLCMRVFANPSDELESDYPEKALTHEIVFPDIDHIKQKFQYEEKLIESAFYAVCAHDDETLGLLFENNAILELPKSNGIYSNKFFIESMCHLKDKNDENRYLLLDTISRFLENGTSDNIARLVKKYEVDYPDDYSAILFLTQALLPMVRTLSTDKDSRLKQKADHQQLINLIKKNKLTDYIPAEYRQLELLTAENKDNPNKISEVIQSWGELTSAEMLRQIQIAAIYNRPYLVGILVDHFKNTYPSWERERFDLIDQKLIRDCAPEVLEQLVKKGFKINSDLIRDLFIRNDVKLFENLLPFIDNRQNLAAMLDLKRLPVVCDLFREVNGLNYLKVFIFLGKLDQIRNNWKENVSAETCQDALMFAYRCQQVNIIKFLEEEKNIKLNYSSLNLLIQVALNTSSLLLLNAINKNFNVLNNHIVADDDNFTKIITLCHKSNDFSLITKNWQKIRQSYQNQVLEMSLTNASEFSTFANLLAWIVSNNAEFCLSYLKKKIEELKFPENKGELKSLERLACLLPEPNVIENISLPEDFSRLCIQADSLHLLRITQQDYTFTIDKVFQSSSGLTKKDKETALVNMLEHNSRLLQDPNLLYGLIVDKCFNSLVHLLAKDKIELSEDQYKFLLNRVFSTSTAQSEESIKEKLSLIEYIFKTPSYSNSEALMEYVKQHQEQIFHYLKVLNKPELIALLLNNPILNLPDNSQMLRGKLFDELFKTVCEEKRLEMVDALLAFPDRFSPDFFVDSHLTAMLDKLGRKDELYNKLYQANCGRIYSHILKSELMKQVFENPGLLLSNPLPAAKVDKFDLNSTLINSVNPVDFAILHRAFREGNFSLINTIFENVPQLQSPSMLARLINPSSSPQLLNFLLGGNPESLLEKILVKKNWSAAIMLLNLLSPADINDKKVLAHLKECSEAILTYYLDQCHKNLIGSKFDINGDPVFFIRNDSRAALFSLLLDVDPKTNPRGLSAFADIVAHGNRSMIQDQLIQFEKELLDKHVPLQKRYIMLSAHSNLAKDDWTICREASMNGIDSCIKNRPVNSTLLDRLFKPSNRDVERATLYKNLFNECKSELQFLVVFYAMLDKREVQALPTEVLKAFNAEDIDDARKIVFDRIRTVSNSITAQELMKAVDKIVQANTPNDASISQISPRKMSPAD